MNAWYILPTADIWLFPMLLVMGYALYNHIKGTRLEKFLIAFAIVVPLDVVLHGEPILGLVTYALLVYGQFYLALKEHKTRGNLLVILLCGLCGGFWFYSWNQSIVTFITKVQENGYTDKANVCAIYVLVLLIYIYLFDSELSKKKAPRKWYMVLSVLGFVAALTRIGLVLAA